MNGLRTWPRATVLLCGLAVGVGRGALLLLRRWCCPIGRIGCAVAASGRSAIASTSAAWLAIGVACSMQGTVHLSHHP